jgi:hypothetical protein
MDASLDFVWMPSAEATGNFIIGVAMGGGAEAPFLWHVNGLFASLTMPKGTGYQAVLFHGGGYK